MKNKTVHLLAAFLMVYIGIEVTIGGINSFPQIVAQQMADNCKSGWIVTFLMIVRDGGPSSGYVSTGFFGGKCLVTLRFLVLNLFIIRPYFGPCRLSRGD